MKPTNNKSLIHFLFNQMDKLDKKQITVEDAKAMAGIAKQVNNSLKYELDRASILRDLEGSSIKIRDVEINGIDTEI
jgi:hypothetical protein